MQCIVVKSGEFENSYSLLYIFFLNPVYVAARSLRSLRSIYKTTNKRIMIFKDLKIPLLVP